MSIYIYLSELFKILPTNSKIISQIHANTAFTTSCSPYTNIHLYREEEWFKVFIHECFHCLGLDFSHLNEFSSLSQKKVLELFPLKTEVNLFETYCEMWGELFNIIFYVYLNTKTQSPDNNYKISLIEDYLLYEKIFSCFQCVKILDFINIKYNNIYSNDEFSQLSRENYKENTNILSYYILKAIYMTYINDFFDWISISNESSIKFIEKQKNLEEYINIIQRNYKGELFLNNISIMEEWISQHKDKDLLENITLKMVVLEQ